MREIEIDRDTFECLKTLANPGEAPGEVIARLLAQATGTTCTPTASVAFQRRPRRIGTLKPFIDSGDFVPGDALHITWTRLGRELTVTIDEHGKLHTDDGRVFTSPSAAAFAVTGTFGANAKFWTHLRSGRSLAWWKEHHEAHDDLQVEQELEPKTSEGTDAYLADPFGFQGRSEPH